ncbi:MAG: nucleotide exchange factor GrpE [Psychrobium sp.]|nr:nucleotide exchange factor GrpE [Psychrobium sp.]
MSEQDLNPKNNDELEDILQNVGEAIDANADESNDEDSTAQRISALEKELAESQAIISGQKDGVLRGKAEVENMRRRVSIDVEKAHKFALNKFANELLPVVDNLERALGSIDKDVEANKGIIEGIEMTLSSMINALDKSGVKEINPKGETFNPELHQAITMIDVPGAEPNTVIDVMQKGFELNGRLLRPAMVVVAKAAAVDTNA